MRLLPAGCNPLAVALRAFLFSGPFLPNLLPNRSLQLRGDFTGLSSGNIRDAKTATER
jgi:hypothetical protein